jgi:F-type H+-transporting ATPase subunit b
MKRQTALGLCAATAAAGLPFAAHAAEGGLKLLSFTTLLGQIITFAILVWVMLKYVWPPLTRAVEARQKEIADGLAAANQGKQELADAESQKRALLTEAKDKSAELLAEGEKQRAAIVEAARADAEAERARIVEAGKREVESERAAMRRELQNKVGELALAGATQILRREVDARAHQDIVSALKQQTQ